MTDLEKTKQINEQIALRADGRISVYCAGAWESSMLIANLQSRIENLELRLDDQKQNVDKQTDLFAVYCKIAEGTFLEEDRCSNFPGDNQVCPPSAKLVARVQAAIGHSYPDDARKAINEVAAWIHDKNNGIPSWTYLQLQKELETNE